MIQAITRIYKEIQRQYNGIQSQGK